MPDDEREREIPPLEGVRDKLLDAAPMNFYFRRLLLPIMLVMISRTAYRIPLRPDPSVQPPYE